MLKLWEFLVILSRCGHNHHRNKRIFTNQAFILSHFMCFSSYFRYFKSQSTQNLQNLSLFKHFLSQFFSKVLHWPDKNCDILPQTKLHPSYAPSCCISVLLWGPDPQFGNHRAACAPGGDRVHGARRLLWWVTDATYMCFLLSLCSDPCVYFAPRRHRSDQSQRSVRSPPPRQLRGRHCWARSGI